MLVFEAVLEVVCVSLPGYIIARQGMFTAEMQKFAANLNVTVFTPCLIFTKLASQLTTDKLMDLAIIPVIFVVQILISYICSIAVAKAFGFAKRPRNFVIAMGVFGNSNSLPISLVLSLSKTIKGLHWDKVPRDNDDEVAARGILYLLIFQQLGQLVRWTWGYNVLLAPAENVEDTTESSSSRLESGESEPLMTASSSDDEGDEQNISGSDDTWVESRAVGKRDAQGSQNGSASSQGKQTPVTNRKYASSISSTASRGGLSNSGPAPDLLPTPVNGNMKSAGRMTSFPSVWSHTDSTVEDAPRGLKGIPIRCRTAMLKATCTGFRLISVTSRSAFGALPSSIQRSITRIGTILGRFFVGVWSFMNPPLWAMLAAIVVASIPDLQRFFFANGTFFKNSVTSAIRQSGGVAVPLILVVLGGNLARNTLPADASHTREDEKEETKLLIASIISRMLLPLIVMAPLLAVTAKYVSISILDDPIFVIVCFLITGAPSALQLAQICQINNVYMGAMSRLLFQSYVVWILPSTLVLVMCALEVVEWAQR